MKLIFLLFSLCYSGCANAPQTEQEVYERAEKKETMRDEIRALRNWCQDTPGMVEVYTGHAGTGERRRMHDDVNYVPRSAHKTDFQCGRSQDVMRQIGRML